MLSDEICVMRGGLECSSTGTCYLFVCTAVPPGTTRKEKKILFNNNIKYLLTVVLNK